MQSQSLNFSRNIIEHLFSNMFVLCCFVPPIDFRAVTSSMRANSRISWSRHFQKLNWIVSILYRGFIIFPIKKSKLPILSKSPNFSLQRGTAPWYRLIPRKLMPRDFGGSKSHNNEKAFKAGNQTFELCQNHFWNYFWFLSLSRTRISDFKQIPLYLGIYNCNLFK